MLFYILLTSTLVPAGVWKIRISCSYSCRRPVDLERERILTGTGVLSLVTIFSISHSVCNAGLTAISENGKRFK